VLETEIGNIPVYNNVREGLEDGHRFNCGVVYLPPSAARDGVAELIRVNPSSTRSSSSPRRCRCTTPARSARWRSRTASTSSAPTASASPMPGTRCGSAARSGGDTPGEALRKGSIAIFSNSGNFTTTIATYLRMAGWGTTTLISSGKDVYIHYAAPDFAFALANDARTKAAVLYAEPGGYYELDAEFNKPIVACVVGRWKAS
jgi:succinyl-CoA synthetase alpha subunit